MSKNQLLLFSLYLASNYTLLPTWFGVCICVFLQLSKNKTIFNNDDNNKTSVWWVARRHHLYKSSQNRNSKIQGRECCSPLAHECESSDIEIGCRLRRRSPKVLLWTEIKLKSGTFLYISYFQKISAGFPKRSIWSCRRSPGIGSLQSVQTNSAKRKGTRMSWVAVAERQNASGVLHHRLLHTQLD